MPGVPRLSAARAPETQSADDDSDAASVPMGLPSGMADAPAAAATDSSTKGGIQSTSATADGAEGDASVAAVGGSPTALVSPASTSEAEPATASDASAAGAGGAQGGGSTAAGGDASPSATGGAAGGSPAAAAAADGATVAGDATAAAAVSGDTTGASGTSTATGATGRPFVPTVASTMEPTTAVQRGVPTMAPTGGRFVRPVPAAGAAVAGDGELADGAEGDLEIFWHDALGKHPLPAGTDCKLCGCTENVEEVSSLELDLLPLSDTFHCVPLNPPAPPSTFVVLPAGGRFVILPSKGGGSEGAPAISKGGAGTDSAGASVGGSTKVSEDGAGIGVFWQDPYGTLHPLPRGSECPCCGDAPEVVEPKEVQHDAWGAVFDCSMLGPTVVEAPNVPLNPAFALRDIYAPAAVGDGDIYLDGFSIAEARHTRAAAVPVGDSKVLPGGDDGEAGDKGGDDAPAGVAYGWLIPILLVACGVVGGLAYSKSKTEGETVKKKVTRSVCLEVCQGNLFEDEYSSGDLTSGSDIDLDVQAASGGDEEAPLAKKMRGVQMEDYEVVRRTSSRSMDIVGRTTSIGREIRLCPGDRGFDSEVTEAGSEVPIHSVRCSLASPVMTGAQVAGYHALALAPTPGRQVPAGVASGVSTVVQMPQGVRSTATLAQVPRSARPGSGTLVQVPRSLQSPLVVRSVSATFVQVTRSSRPGSATLVQVPQSLQSPLGVRSGSATFVKGQPVSSGGSPFPAVVSPWHMGRRASELPPLSLDSQTDAAARSQRLSVFDQIDRNHDGTLSKQEWNKYAFDAFDANHDGTISVQEVRAAGFGSGVLPPPPPL